jgi:uroporphyrinogen III methyltransferase / synthase
VEAFLSRLQALKLDSRWLKGIKIGAMGPATAEALGKKGLIADYVPETFNTDGFVAGLANQHVAGSRFLLFRADIAPKDLIVGITQLGAEVNEITAYRTAPYAGDVSLSKKMLTSGEIEVITFASSSTVSNLISIMGEDWQAINGAMLACIGPQTAATAKKAGLRVDTVATEHTIPGLVKAIEDYFRRNGREEQ